MRAQILGRLIDWAVALFLLGSVLLSVGLYSWRTDGIQREKEQIVLAMSNVFGTSLSEETAVVYHTNNYTPFLPTPSATDGDSETVIRVSSDEVDSAIEFLNRKRVGEVKPDMAGFPPWESLNLYFGQQLRAKKSTLRFYVRDTSERGEVTNCDLLIVNREDRLLGFYQWDL